MNCQLKSKNLSFCVFSLVVGFVFFQKKTKHKIFPGGPYYLHLIFIMKSPDMSEW